MDYTKNIATYTDFVNECAMDRDGIMDSRVRSLLNMVGADMIGENIQAIRGAAWQWYKELYHN